jgi:hypothetical protein
MFVILASSVYRVFLYVVFYYDLHLREEVH